MQKHVTFDNLSEMIFELAIEKLINNVRTYNHVTNSLWEKNHEIKRDDVIFYWIPFHYFLLIIIMF